jgi:thiol-disulfide isomerase/thioredoxin
MTSEGTGTASPGPTTPKGRGRTLRLVVAGIAGAAIAAAVIGKLARDGAAATARREEAKFGVDRVAPPVAAPAVQVEGPDGRPLALPAAKGALTFVNFWATWCPPCRAEMPSMLQLGREISERYPGRFRMVAVSVDDGWPEVQRFFGGRLPGGLSMVRDPDQSATRAYYCAARGACPQSFKFPESYVVDGEGRIVAYFVGPRDWNAPAARRILEHLLD